MVGKFCSITKWSFAFCCSSSAKRTVGLLALCFGLRLVRDDGLSPLIVKSNSLRVIQFILNRLSTHTELFWLIFEVKNFLSPKHSFQIRHISRICNIATDASPKYSIHYRNFFIWVEDFAPHLCCFLWELLSCC